MSDVDAIVEDWLDRHRAKNPQIVARQRRAFIAGYELAQEQLKDAHLTEIRDMERQCREAMEEERRRRKVSQ